MTLYTFSCTTMKENATAVVDGGATIANDTRIHARTVTHDTKLCPHFATYLLRNGLLPRLH